jgi:hypothetical protein
MHLQHHNCMELTPVGPFADLTTALLQAHDTYNLTAPWWVTALVQGAMQAPYLPLLSSSQMSKLDAYFTLFFYSISSRCADCKLFN